MEIKKFNGYYLLRKYLYRTIKYQINHIRLLIKTQILFNHFYDININILYIMHNIWFTFNIKEKFKIVKKISWNIVWDKIS